MRRSSWVATRLIRFTCVFLAGCAMQPLATPEATPASTCPPEVRRVALFGFQDEDPELSKRVATLFGGAAAVEQLPLGAYFASDASGRSDLGIALIDVFENVKSNATARMWTNFYFTITVVDIWILPILHATDLFRSSAELTAEIGVLDAGSAATPRRTTLSASVDEKPTGYLGPSDEEFTLAMVDRAKSNLAVAIYEDACKSVRQASRSSRE